VFEVEDRRVHIYPGNYEDYLWRKQGGPEKITTAITEDLSPMVVGVAEVPAAVKVAEVPVAAAPVKRLNPIKLRQLEDRLRGVEEEILRLETGITAAELKMGVFTSAGESQRTAAELDELRGRRAVVLSEWEELALTLEEQSLA
jgi:ATP-binding cassette subfamily F protein 3